MEKNDFEIFWKLYKKTTKPNYIKKPNYITYFQNFCLGDTLCLLICEEQTLWTFVSMMYFFWKLSKTASFFPIWKILPIFIQFKHWNIFAYFTLILFEDLWFHASRVFNTIKIDFHTKWFVLVFNESDFGLKEQFLPSYLL